MSPTAQQDPRAALQAALDAEQGRVGVGIPEDPTQRRALLGVMLRQETGALEAATPDQTFRSGFGAGFIGTAGTAMRAARLPEEVIVNTFGAFGFDEGDQKVLRTVLGYLPGFAGARALAGRGEAAQGVAQELGQGDPTFTGSVGQAAGSAAVMAPAGIAGGALGGTVGGAVASGGLGATIEAESMLEQGEALGASPRQKLAAMAAGAAVGSTEAFGADRALASLGKVFAGGSSEIRKTVAIEIMRAALKSGAEEGLEELGQGMGEEAIAQWILEDPDKHGRSVMDWLRTAGNTALDQGLPAAVVGMVMGGAARAAEITRGQEGTPSSGQVPANAPLNDFGALNREQQARERAGPNAPADVPAEFEPLRQAVEKQNQTPVRFVTPQDSEAAGRVQALAEKLGIDVAFIEGAPKTVQPAAPPTQPPVTGTVGFEQDVTQGALSDTSRTPPASGAIEQANAPPTMPTEPTMFGREERKTKGAVRGDVVTPTVTQPNLLDVQKGDIKGQTSMLDQPEVAAGVQPKAPAKPAARTMADRLKERRSQASNGTLGFRAWVRAMGGLNVGKSGDLGGEVRDLAESGNEGSFGLGPLVRGARSSIGVSVDDVLEAAMERGYLPPGSGVREVFELIDSDFTPEKADVDATKFMAEEAKAYEEYVKSAGYSSIEAYEEAQDSIDAQARREGLDPDAPPRPIESDATDDTPFAAQQRGGLRYPAAYAGGRVVIDVNSTRPVQLLFHEGLHHIAGVNPEGFARLLGAMTNLKPQQIEAARRAYATAFGKDAPQGAALDEEAAAVFSENIAGLLEQTFNDPAKLARVFADRNVFEVVRDMIARIAKRFGGQMQTSIEKRLAALNADGDEVKLALLWKETADAVSLWSELPEDEKAKFAAAYHGTPHDFDRFDMSKVGTGEGNQAYGHGLYFAEKKEIAEHYRKKLSNAGDDGPGSAAEWVKFHGSKDAALRAARDTYKSEQKHFASDPRGLADLHRIYPRLIASLEKYSPGRLYEVELAPAEDEYLLWDRPLSEQSEKVKAALREMPSRVDDPEMGVDLIKDDRIRGSSLYSGIASMVPDNGRSASAALRAAGIRGIKYLDGSSRSKGEGDYNYVLFDDKDITIKAKFAVDRNRVDYRDLRKLLHQYRKGVVSLDEVLGEADIEDLVTEEEADTLLGDADFVAFGGSTNTPRGYGADSVRSASNPFVALVRQREKERRGTKAKFAVDRGPVDVRALAARIEGQFPGVVMELSEARNNPYHSRLWRLDSIVVPSGERGQGTGSKAMAALVQAADAAGATIGLDPSTDFGATSVDRLRKFYSRFGFKRNTGRSADLSVSAAMLRIPQGPRFAVAPPTDSPEFKRWFGDSKVVDAQGRPLVVYHGSPNDFTVFDIGRQERRSEGPGFYFTTDKRVAEGYGTARQFYLSLRKPLAYDAKPFSLGVATKLLKKIAQLESATTGDDIRDGFLANFGDTYTKGVEGAAREGAVLLAAESSALDQIGGIVGAGVDRQHVLEAVTDVTGYDGFVAIGFSNEGDASNTIYVAFRPEQIKSATGNRGTFDAANPDIRFAVDPDRVEAAADTGLSGAEMPMRLERPAENIDPTSAPDVIDALAKVIEAADGGTPIRTGRMGRKSRTAAGFFKVRPEVIRLKTANDIPTAAHEAAHALEKHVYGWPKGGPWKNPLVNLETQKELVTLGRALYGDRKPAGGYKREGFAEYVRLYVSNPDALPEAAPKFHEWFTQAFLPSLPKVAKELDRARELTTRWREQGAVARAKASVIDPASASEKWKKLREKLRYTRIVTEVLESGQALKEAQATAESRADLKPENAPFTTFDELRLTHDAKVAYMAESGMIDFNGNVVGGPLSDITPLIKGRYHDFVAFLWAQRALALRASGRNAGISIADAQQIVKELGDEKMQLAASKLYEWNDGVLNYAEEASPHFGRVVARIRAVDPGFYIPLQREMDQLDRSWAGGMADGGNPLKKLRGSGRRIKDPIQTVLSRARKLVLAAHQRKVMDQVIALSRVEGMGQWIEEVPPTQVPLVKQSLGDVLKKIEERVDPLGEGVEGLDQIREQFQDLLDLSMTEFGDASRPDTKDPIIPYWEDGEVRWYQVNPDLYRALSTMEVYRLPGMVGAVAGAATRTFRAGTTGLRAPFGLIRNPSRDVQAFVLQSRSTASSPVLIGLWMHQMGRSFISSVTAGKVTDEWADLAQRLGVTMAQPLGQDISHTKRAARRLSQGTMVRTMDPRNWFDWFREFIQFPEGATRTAELRAIARDIGWKPGEPMTREQAQRLTLAGKKVTTDFTASGNFSRVMNQIVPFFNSAIQGPRAAAQAIKHHPVKFMLRGMAITASTVALWLQNRDEEWWKEIPDEEKYGYWHFKIEVDGKTEIVRLPRAYEIGGVFAALPEAMLEAWYADDPAAASEWARQFVATTTPDITPAVAKPFIEWMANYDFFRERPIVPRGEQDKPAEEQVGPYTSRLAKLFGEQVGASPRKIDHAINSIFGPVAGDVITGLGLGAQARAARGEAAELPVIGTLFRRGGELISRPKSVEKLYDAYGAALKLQASDKIEETREQRNARLALQDAVQAVGALSFIRWEAPDEGVRQTAYLEMLAIARDARAAAQAGTSHPKQYDRAAKMAKRRREQLEAEKK